MRILGIDPGSQTTGWGLLEGTPRGPRALGFGTIRPRREDPLPDRLLALYRGLRETLDLRPPELMAIETAFYHKSARSTLVLGQVRGALLVCARDAGIAVEEYSPREIKLAVTGRGGAAKEQVQFMVRAMLGLRESPPLDASDALAVALCAWQRRSTRAAASRGAERS